MRAPIRTTLVVASAAIVAGCGEAAPNASRGIDGAYLLKRVAERDTPTEVYSGTYVGDEGKPHALRITVLGGNLTLSAGGTRYQHFVARSGTDDGVAILVANVNDRGRCTRDGATLSCASDLCENLAFTATLATNALTIVQDLSGEDAAPVPHRYELVGPVD